MPIKCKECNHVGNYTSGPFQRNPHYCCELVWELFHEDYKVNPDTVDGNCPLKNEELVKGIMELRVQLGLEEE